jgi:hypothetical protein
MSSSSSPRIHLPPQLLAQLPPSPLQAAAAASSNWQLSPKGRSRLSRSELPCSTDTAQQQQRGSGKSSNTSLAAATTPGGNGKGQLAGQQGSEAAEPCGGTTSPSFVTADWASWLQQLLFELLLMLSEVRWHLLRAGGMRLLVVS